MSMQWHVRWRDRGNRSSYITRHWRGELTLPVSYWINNTLLSIGMVALLTGAPWRQAVDTSPRLYSAAIAAIWSLLAVITTWQIVGTWRCANAYLAARKRPLWAILAKIALIVSVVASAKEFVFTGAPQISEYAKIAAGRDPLGTYTLHTLRNATELEVAGSIVFGLTEHVSRVLDAHPTIKVIHLNSDGGRVSEARNLRDLISARRLTTYTATGCFSACTLAYAAGVRRLIASDAALGFHQYAFPGVRAEALSSVYETDKSDWIERGFGKPFVDRAFTIAHSDLWRPSHAELLAARVITGYAPSNDVASVAFGDLSSDVAELDSRLTTIPVFVALKTHERATYDQLVSRMRTELQQGRSKAELRESIFPILQELVKRKLPYASDKALVSFIDIVMREMAALRSVNPDLCYEYLFPARGAAPFDATKYIGAELLQKQLVVMGDIVRSASEERSTPPKPEQVEQQRAAVYRALVQRHGVAAVRKLASSGVAQDGKDEVCRLTYDFYEGILQLPDAGAARLLRYMFAASK
jgi:hypothetical protein